VPGLDVLRVLDAMAVRRWCAAALAGMTAARAEIDDLNVYPVPDGDTGTNLALTMSSVVDAVQAGSDDLAGTARAMAHGALMGARGNSGVILSQVLRGFADVLGALEQAGPADLARALSRAAELAYAAVANPVEGTLLTVAREAAEAVQALDGDLAQLVRRARETAADSLARTPDLLPQLQAAGVVDAGGRGFCILLEALEQVVTGQAPAPVPPLLVARDRSGLARARESGSEQFAYEVQYLLRDAEDGAVEVLREALAQLGDSLVVVGDHGLHNVHVHVNDVGAALEAGVEAGRPFRVTVTRFADQVAADVGHVGADQVAADPFRAGPHERSGRRTVVAVVPGPGLARLFTSGGARVVHGGPTANRSTTNRSTTDLSAAELLAAVRCAGSREVVLLPNDVTVRAVAEKAAEHARQDGLDVQVVPTGSVVQGLAALAVADPERVLAEDVRAMTEAAGATRWAELTYAVRSCSTPAGPCRAGEVLGLVEGVVVAVGTDLEQVACSLLLRLLDGGSELVTLVAGSQLPDGFCDRLAAYAGQVQATVEVVVCDGGQPHYPLLLGVE